MIAKDAIQKMLEAELAIIVAHGQQVTLDPAKVRAEIRAECLRELLRQPAPERFQPEDCRG